jgi:four helix bundle protein
MAVQSFKDLEVWQIARKLVSTIYVLTKPFPKEEIYGLTSQIRRAAISIPSNIAEGRAKRSTGDYIRFLNIAYGSCAELETQLLIAQDLDYCSERDAELVLTMIYQINRMLSGLITSLEKRRATIGV